MAFLEYHDLSAGQCLRTGDGREETRRAAAYDHNSSLAHFGKAKKVPRDATGSDSFGRRPREGARLRPVLDSRLWGLKMINTSEKCYEFTRFRKRESGRGAGRYPFSLRPSRSLREALLNTSAFPERVLPGCKTISCSAVWPCDE
jgi:hypothetical protein